MKREELIRFAKHLRGWGIEIPSDIMEVSVEEYLSLSPSPQPSAKDEAEKCWNCGETTLTCEKCGIVRISQPSATAEEFIREKIRQKLELKGDMMGLWCYSLNGEDALRWAHEYASKPVAEREVPEEKYPPAPTSHI